MNILGQEIYKEFDYFIRFLHHRVLKVGRRGRIDILYGDVCCCSVGRISIAFNGKVKN